MTAAGVFRGVFIIAATPFRPDGSVDHDSIDSLARFYLARGVAGITILGMMGEAHKLTAEEACAVVDRFAEAVAGRVPLVVGVSAPGLRPLAELAHHAAAAGAAAVMVAPPPGLKGDDDVLAYFQAVAGVVPPGMQIVLQDFPLAVPVPLSAALLERLFAAVPAITVLKHEDWPGLAKLSAVRRAEAATGRRRIAILVGNGGLFLPEELERGADGAMTGFAFPELLVEVCRRHADGDRDGAGDLFDAYLPLIRYEQQPGYGLAVRKRILCARGAIANPDLRPPGARLSNHDLAELQRLLRRLHRRLDRDGFPLPVAFPSVGAVA